ncbi:hypothetical protein HDV03_003975 [Kappamyces sp. JEL0829]|nr:hypothetical protein HDV03_003975 [Kappamyces sp. JEL0829]
MYMTLNGHRYGCLTTYNCTWFFCKVEDALSPTQSRLLVTPAIKCGSTEPYTLLSAWLYMLTTIATESDWMYPSGCNQVVVHSHSTPTDETRTSRYKSVQLDGVLFCDEVLYGGQVTGIATGRYMNEQNVILKTIDVSKRWSGLSQFNLEVSMYAKMEDLQGTVMMYKSMGLWTLNQLGDARGFYCTCDGSHFNERSGVIVANEIQAFVDGLAAKP